GKAHGMCTRLRSGRIVVMSVIDEPDCEAVFEARPQCRFHLGSIPVGLPGQGIDVQQRLQQQHFAMSVSVRYRACSTRSCKRTYQHIALRIQWSSVGRTKLIPTVQIGSWNLMAMVGL